jgi:hypothetical protein
VAAGKGQRHHLTLAAGLQREPQPLLVLHRLVDGPNRGAGRAAVHDHRGEGVGRHAGHARIVGIERDGATGAHRADQRGLFLAHAGEVAKKFGVYRGHRGHHPYGRRRQPGQIGDLSALVGADLHDQSLVVRRQAQQGQR